MKAKYALVIPLVAVLALVLVAGPALGKAGSITGGGWFINEVPPFGNKITFGFNALPTSDDSAKGQFHLIDHGSNPKTRMHGTIDSMDLTGTQGSFEFSGKCSIDGVDGVHYTVWIGDDGEPGFGEGDFIMIAIGGLPLDYAGVLGGGNIKRHEK